MSLRIPATVGRLGGAAALVLLAAACSGTGSAATSAPAATVAATDTAAAASAGAPSAAAPTAAAGPVALAVGTDAKVGKYLTGPNGKTLYVFTKDSANTSVCTGKCIQTWPALLAQAASDVKAPADAKGAFSTFARPDGAMQVAYNGKPLYYYGPDQKPGDVTGQGVGGVWFVAAP